MLAVVAQIAQHEIGVPDLPHIDIGTYADLPLAQRFVSGASRCVSLEGTSSGPAGCRPVSGASSSPCSCGDAAGRKLVQGDGFSCSVSGTPSHGSPSSPYRRGVCGATGTDGQVPFNSSGSSGSGRGKRDSGGRMRSRSACPRNPAASECGRNLRQTWRHGGFPFPEKGNCLPPWGECVRGPLPWPAGRRKRRPFVAEADFIFGRMHVDVHFLRGHVHEQDRLRVLFGQQTALVGFTHGLHEQLVVDCATVDVEEQTVCAGLGLPGRRGQTVRPETARRAIERNERFRDRREARWRPTSGRESAQPETAGPRVPRRER